MNRLLTLLCLTLILVLQLHATTHVYGPVSLSPGDQILNSSYVFTNVRFGLEDPNNPSSRVIDTGITFYNPNPYNIDVTLQWQGTFFPRRPSLAPCEPSTPADPLVLDPQPSTWESAGSATHIFNHPMDRPDYSTPPDQVRGQSILGILFPVDANFYGTLTVSAVQSGTANRANFVPFYYGSQSRIDPVLSPCNGKCYGWNIGCAEVDTALGWQNPSLGNYEFVIHTINYARHFSRPPDDFPPYDTGWCPGSPPGTEHNHPNGYNARVVIYNISEQTIQLTLNLSDYGGGYSYTVPTPITVPGGGVYRFRLPDVFPPTMDHPIYIGRVKGTFTSPAPNFPLRIYATQDLYKNNEYDPPPYGCTGWPSN